MGYMEQGNTYQISGNFTNVDGKVYIAKVTGYLKDDFKSVRKATPQIVNGSVTFTPVESGLYEALLWNSGTGDIIASDIRVEQI